MGKEVRFNSILLPQTGRIGVFSFCEINTLVEITKDGKAFPVGRQVYGGIPAYIFGDGLSAIISRD